MQKSSKNLGGRPRTKDSILWALSDCGRLRKNPNHITGRNKWLVRCEKQKCKNYLVYAPNNKNRRYLCPDHRGFQIIAGHATASKYWIRWKSEIVAWKKTIVNGKAHHRPQSACKEPGCTRLILFPPQSRKIDRFLLRCISHYVNPKKLRPYEVAYNRLHRRHRASLTSGRKSAPITLTYEQFFAVAKKKKCFYCCLPLARQESVTRAGRKAVYSFLDRTNTLKGYEPGNVVPCCGLCNKTKSAWLTKREMQIIGLMRQGFYSRASRAVNMKMKYHRAESKQIEKVTERSKAGASSGTGRPARLRDEIID